MKTILLFFVVFIMYSCEKDDQADLFELRECQMTWKFTNFTSLDVKYFSIQVQDRKRENVKFLPPLLPKGNGYSIILYFETDPGSYHPLASAFFDIEDDERQKTINLTKIE